MNGMYKTTIPIDLNKRKNKKQKTNTKPIKTIPFSERKWNQLQSNFKHSTNIFQKLNSKTYTHRNIKSRKKHNLWAAQIVLLLIFFQNKVNFEYKFFLNEKNSRAILENVQRETFCPTESNWKEKKTIKIKENIHTKNNRYVRIARNVYILLQIRLH